MKQLILFLAAITGAVILLNIVYNAGKNQDIDSKFNLMAKLLSQKATQRKTITIEESLKAMKNNGMPMEPADPAIMKYKEVYFKPEALSFNDNKTAKWLGGTCPEIWNKWLQIAEAHEAGIPPLEIPDEMWQEYTLFGRIKVIGFYFNQVSTPESRVWPAIDKQMEGTKEQIIGASTYQGSTEALYNAMTHYKQYIEGKVGVVVGSERPWAELMALKHGAKAMTTLEYWPTEIQTKKYNMTWVHPIDMAKKWNSYAESFDFVVSYSSIEHSGLGRYGDPLDPFGDLREMAKMHCLLKPGGIFFFAVPMGKDAIYWNAHRVYGAIRVPWMLRGEFSINTLINTVSGLILNVRLCKKEARVQHNFSRNTLNLGFKLLGVFANPSDTKPSEGIPTDIIWGTDWTRQPVLILQKV